MICALPPLGGDVGEVPSIQVSEGGDISASPSIVRRENRWTQKDTQSPLICKRLVWPICSIVGKKGRLFVDCRTNNGRHVDEVARQRTCGMVRPDCAIISQW